MLWLLLTALFCCCLLAILYWSPIHIRLYYKRVNENDDAFIELRMWFGLLHWHHRISQLHAGVSSDGVEVHAKVKSASGSDTKKNAYGLHDAITFVRQLPAWNDLYHRMQPTVKKLLRRTVIEHVEADLQVGTGDVVTTGMLVGTTYSLMAVLLGRLSSLCIMPRMPAFKIRPSFGRAMLHGSVDCIVHVRAGNAMFAGLRLASLWRRRVSHGAPHSGPDANSDVQHQGNG